MSGPLCVVLAGGLGTRMRPVTETVPKVLIPVLDEPFLAWQLELLFRAGVGRVVLSVGYKAEMVHTFLRERGEGVFGGEVSVVPDGPELLGTGGAVRRVLDEGAIDEPFLLTYGDSYLPIDHGAVFARFRASGKPALMTVLENAGKWDTSNADYGDGQVRIYDKARKFEARVVGGYRFVDYGLSAFEPRLVRDFFPAGTKGDLSDMVHATSLRGDLAGCLAPSRFFEIGSPQGLADLEEQLRREAVSSGRRGLPLAAPQ